VGRHGSSSGGIWLVALGLFLAAPYVSKAGGTLPHSAPPAPPSPTSRAARAVAFAAGQIGKPYVWGAEGPDAYDCSGLTMAAWTWAGRSIPRTAQGQLDGLPRVTGAPVAGDLIVYQTDGPSRRHVAIVVDAARMVEARSRATGVVVSPIRGGWVGVVRP
jgi:cell wall-associated NlpC family hydrolase